MANTMMLNDDIDKTKYYTDEQKAEMKNANEGKTVCPIMSVKTINYSGTYAVCLKELCALWDDWKEKCAFCKTRTGRE